MYSSYRDIPTTKQQDLQSLRNRLLFWTKKYHEADLTRHNAANEMRAVEAQITEIQGFRDPVEVLT